MSVWPFGQSSSAADINRVLENYFTLLEQIDIPAGDVPDPEHLPPSLFADSKSKNKNSAKKKRMHSPDESESDNEEMHSDDTHNGLTPSDLDSASIDTLLGEAELLNELSRQNNKLLDFICYGFFYRKESGSTEPQRVSNLQYLVEELLYCCDNIDVPTDDGDQQPRPVDPAVAAERANPGGVEPYNIADLSRQTTNASESEKDHEDEEDNPNGKYLARATLIAEIFAADIWLISDALIKHIPYLESIWGLITHPKFTSEKSPLVAIFIKINQNLLFTRQDEYLQFVRGHTTLVDDMLNHIDISLLMDFLLKLIGSDRIDAPTGIIDMLTEQGIVAKLLDFLDNERYPSDTQAYVGDFLKAIIAISANAPIDDVSVGPNDITRELASPESIERLTNIMIKERGPALNIAVSVVIELIRKNNSDYDQINLLATTLRDNKPTSRDPIYLGYLLKKFTQELTGLFQIILDIEFDDSVQQRQNQLGETFKPLGFERFKIVELIAELLHCSNMGLMNSKRAESIAIKRDKYRRRFLRNEHTMADHMHRLSINEADHENAVASTTTTHEYDDDDDDNITNSNSTTTTTPNANDATSDENGNINDEGALASGSNSRSNSQQMRLDAELEKFLQENDNDDCQEVDESFEIPYVKSTQNDKLRKSPTIGDFYKITLYDNYIIPKILVLFLRYPWNNFWHNVIFDIIQQIFNGRMDFSYNSFLVYSLFDIKGSRQFNNIEPGPKNEKMDIDDFKITTDFILKGYQNSYKFYDKQNMNLGYMGHLVLIAEEVVKFSKLYKVELISPDIFTCLQDEDWQYYSEEVLNDTRMMYSKILGGGTYVEDSNGNIIPQLPDATYNADTIAPGAQPEDNQGEDDATNGINGDDNMGGGLVNVEELEEQLSTESDLHFKLKQMLISRSRTAVDEANEKKGVIILGPPPDASA
ncbi:Sap155 protein [Maudiozyma humilis]|uniref:Sap155 protein n=1 Tax=Maudiozyma humilis TaxID=51915 RepID=A0AAV5RZN0_MAUHU|nr:Sap155 protein [Kazachstania humilis]